MMSLPADERDLRAIEEVCAIVSEWHVEQKLLRIKWLPKETGVPVIATRPEWVMHLRQELRRLTPEVRSRAETANDLPISIAANLGIRLVSRLFAFEVPGLLGARWKYWSELPSRSRDDLDRRLKRAVADGLVQLGVQMGLG